MGFNFISQLNKEVFKNKISENKEKIEKLTFPHGEEAVRSFEKEYPGNKEQVEKVKEIFETFFKQEMENIQIFKSKEGVEFPYTKISIAKLAKELYAKNAVKPLKDNLEKNNQRTSIEKEFIFGSFLAVENGTPFTFTEEAMHKAVMYLPRALESLKSGQEPEDREVYTLGSPTNLLGKMTPEFFNGLKEDPFRNLGRVYSELIKEKISSANENNNTTSIELFGISMGAGLAAMTGEKLLEDEQFTQESQPEDTKERKIFLQIKAEVPVTLSRSKIKKIQIPVGFIIEVAKGIMQNPYIRKVGGGESKFVKKMDAELAKRGIHENMSSEQKEMKKKSITNLMLALGRGLNLKPETKVDEIFGLHDLTTFTSSFKKDAKIQSEEHPDTLGSTVVPRTREESRTSAVNANHSDIPASNFYRSSELRRIKVAAEKLLELGKIDN